MYNIAEQTIYIYPYRYIVILIRFYLFSIACLLLHIFLRAGDGTSEGGIFLKKLEHLLEWGGIKRDIIFLVLSGLSLLASIFGFSPFPFDNVLETHLDDVARHVDRVLVEPGRFVELEAPVAEFGFRLRAAVAKGAPAAHFGFAGARMSFFGIHDWV